MLVIVGILTALVGGFLALGGKVPFGSLPGDINNSVIQPIVNFFEALPGRVLSAISGLSSKIVSSIMSDIPGSGIVGSAISKIGGMFAEGGFVPGTGPQMAIVHGGEYILSNAMLARLATPGGISGSLPSLSAGSGGGGDAGLNPQCQRTTHRAACMCGSRVSPARQSLDC